jgi:enoyl-CoA hydratase/carnithine racemase
VLLVQNSVPARIVGTATSGNNFFRQIGVSLGATVIGTLFTSRLASSLEGFLSGMAVTADDAARAQLAQARAEGLDASSLTPAAVAQLPDVLRSGIVGAYVHSLTPVLAGLVPILVVAAVISLFLPHLDLSTKSGLEQVEDQDRESAREAVEELITREEEKRPPVAAPSDGRDALVTPPEPTCQRR